MSTDSGTAEKSNETKLPNQINILKILQSIFIPSAIISTIVQYITTKSASSFYGINSELFYSQQFWSTIIDFFIPALFNLSIFLTPLIVADYYRNSLKPKKEDSDSKGKTHNPFNVPSVILIFFYALLSGCHILKQYANLYDSINQEINLSIYILLLLIMITLVIIILLLCIEIYRAISKAQQAEKDRNWCLGEEIFSIFLFILSNGILWFQLYHVMKENICLLLMPYIFFILYYLATSYYFLDEVFSCTSIVCCIILAFCTIIIPLYSGNTYYSGKKQYEIVEPISGSNIASGSNLKVVILHKNNQLLLMDFRISTDENTKDGSAPPQEIEKQAQQNIKEILSKASASNLNIKKGEYTIQDENLYKFYTVTFNKVNCE